MSDLIERLRGLALTTCDVAADRIEELEKRVEQLQGMKFSDRNYTAMKSRVEELERKLLEANQREAKDYAELLGMYEEVKALNLRLLAKNADLLQALKEVKHWFESERKSISKGNGSQWSMWQCEEQIEVIDAAIKGADK